MSSLPDIALLYALIACIAGYLIFRYLVKISLRNKKQDLVRKIKDLRLVSIKLQKSLSNYILSKNADRELLYADVTFGQYYRYLKHNHAAHLSSKLIEKLQNSDNPLLIKKTTEELQEQDRKMNEAQGILSAILMHHP